jgi:hypothetical protein
MKTVKRSLFFGSIFVLISGTLSHFLYEWLGNAPLVGLFTPVNESTWEHMKLLFFPMLLDAFYLLRKYRHTCSCIVSALPAGILTGTFLIPIIFYTYTGILGNHFLILDLMTFVVSVLLAFYMVWRLTQSCRAQKYTVLLWGLVGVLFLYFLLFTYHTPGLGIFAEP